MTERNHVRFRVLEAEELEGLYLTGISTEEWNSLSPSRRETLVRERLAEYVRDAMSFRFTWKED